MTMALSGRRLIADLFAPTAGRRRLVEYVSRQTALGRHMAEVLEDPYVINRTLRQDRRRLLVDPSLLALWHLGLGEAPAAPADRPPPAR
jgi:hypothetical protein